MAESLDIFRYVSYLRLRWAWIAGSGAVAVALALAVSLALPRQYTATARIVIEPPAGTDPRSAMAVSPVYLESLKTYEEFAANDSLFQKAIDQFRLRALLGARPIESLKKRVLASGAGTQYADSGDRRHAAGRSIGAASGEVSGGIHGGTEPDDRDGRGPGFDRGRGAAGARDARDARRDRERAGAADGGRAGGRSAIGDGERGRTARNAAAADNERAVGNGRRRQAIRATRPRGWKNCGGSLRRSMRSPASARSCWRCG